MTTDNAREADMMDYEEAADTNLRKAAEEAERLMPNTGGVVGPNHWSYWTERISDGCRMPLMTEERRAWFAERFPTYTWDTAVKASEIDAEELAERIRRVLRGTGSQGV